MRHGFVTLRAPLCTVLILALLSAACSRDEDAPAPPASRGEAGTPAATGGHTYTCPDGFTFTVRIDKGNAIVSAGGQSLTLPPVEGASGAHYAHEGVRVLVQGDEATYMKNGEATRRCTAG